MMPDVPATPPLAERVGAAAKLLTEPGGGPSLRPVGPGRTVRPGASASRWCDVGGKVDPGRPHREGDERGALAILRRHMVEVIAIHVDLTSEELGEAALDDRVKAAMGRVPGIASSRRR